MPVTTEYSKEEKTILDVLTMAVPSVTPDGYIGLIQVCRELEASRIQVRAGIVDACLKTIRSRSRT